MPHAGEPWARGENQAGDQQHWHQSDGKPVVLDPGQPVPAAGDAPDVVHGLLNPAEQGENHEDEQDCPGHAERAAAGFLDELANAAGRLLLRVGHAIPGAGGGHHQVGFRNGAGRGSSRFGIRRGRHPGLP